jgi:hypothetical protein
MEDAWEFAIFVFTGLLGFGLLVRATRTHEAGYDIGPEGWNPPAVMDHREAAGGPPVPDWPSPARLRRAAGLTGEEPRPSDEEAIGR